MATFLDIKNFRQTVQRILHRQRRTVLHLFQFLRVIVALPHPLDALLHFGHSHQVLIQCLLVGAVDFGAQRLGGVTNAIDDADLPGVE